MESEMESEMEGAHETDDHRVTQPRGIASCRSLVALTHNAASWH